MLSTLFFVLLVILYSWTAYNLPVLFSGLYLQSVKAEVPTRTRLPSFSLLIPVKNEELVIGRLLERLVELDYPRNKVEVIVAEDGSEDRTVEICERFVERHNGFIRLFHRENSVGKPSALNFALSKARGEIIGVLDSDSVPERRILLDVARYFEGENVAAVQGLTCSINCNQNIVARLAACEEATWMRVFVRGKSLLGLFVPLTGSCSFVKRSVLEKIGGWDDRSLAEDVELAVRLTAAGYRIRYAEDVCSLQESASSIRRLMRQRMRWFRGYMETCLKYGRLIMKPFKLGLDVKVTLAGPFVLSLCPMSYVLGVCSFAFRVTAPWVSSPLLMIGTLLTVGVFFFLGAVWMYQARPLKARDLILVPAMYLYWILLSAIAFLTLLSFCFRREQTWEKTQKTGRMNDEFTARGEFGSLVHADSLAAALPGDTYIHKHKSAQPANTTRFSCLEILVANSENASKGSHIPVHSLDLFAAP